MYAYIDIYNYIKFAVRKCGSRSHSHIYMCAQKKELNGMLLKPVFLIVLN